MMREHQFIHKNEQSKNRRRFILLLLLFSVCNKSLGLAQVHMTSQMRCSHLAVFSNFSAKNIIHTVLDFYFLDYFLFISESNLSSASFPSGDSLCHSARIRSSSLEGADVSLKNSESVIPSAKQIFSSVGIVGALYRIKRFDSVDCGMPARCDS